MEPGPRGKTALLTRASRTIGAASAFEYACEDVNVCLVARDLMKSHEVATSTRTVADADVAASGSGASSAEFTIGGAVNVAILNSTKAMAYVGREDGVPVNAINPGLIEADRFIRNIVRTMRRRQLNRDQAITFLSTHAPTRFP